MTPEALLATTSRMMLDAADPRLGESIDLQEDDGSSRGVCSIDVLPDELLASILRLVLSDSLVVSYEIVKNFVKPSSLVTLSSVCRRWRGCLLTTSSYWQKIVVGRHTEWLQTCLDRSGELLVDLAFYHASTFVASKQLLFEQIDRIRLIATRETDDAALDLLNMLLKKPMPMLEDLRLNACKTTYEVQFGDEELYDLPALRHVHFQYAHVYWQSAVVQKLQTIKLSDWHHHDPQFNTMDFLRCLDGCRALEELKIDFALPVCQCVKDLDDSEEPAPIAHLPNLRKLRLLCPPSGLEPDVFHLLAHIRLPLACDIGVYVQVAAEDEYEDGEAPDGFLDHIPCDPECIPILGAATSAIIFPWNFRCSADGGASFYLDMDPLGHGLRRDEKFFEDFRTLFADAPLAHLTVERFDVPESAWVDLFRAFPALGRLTLEGPPRRLRTVLAALRQSERVLPNLRRLDILRCRWEPELLDGIALCLQFRAAYETMPLSELHVNMFRRNQEESDLQLVHEKSLQLLRSLVTEKVVYEDVDAPSR
ncbi:hypothetical protein BV20DRAFT_241784 [Pilatotrama ljubarskyi]|nr:hypothetical protein BV20DRAFT_241784 [Pilatotrama ljubarskyi]